jgi:S1-C subfamily serine protease
MAARLTLADPQAHLLHGGCEMSEGLQDDLTRLSDVLSARAAAATPHVAGLRASGTRPLTATLWRAGVAVASEQCFPQTAQAELVLPDGRSVAAEVAGRDPSTNVVALRFADGGLAGASAAAAAAEPRLGALALLATAAGDGTPSVRLTMLRAVGPAWHSRRGGRIDRRIALDALLARSEEGGPVFDAAGGLIGMSTAGPRGRGLVIPAATIERVLVPLLDAGQIERGWLGAALHPVALPPDTAAAAGLDRGLMVLRLAPDGPAARAGVIAGDILLRIGEVAARYPNEISRLLVPESVGQTLSLQLARAGALLNLTATITARPQA